MGIMGLITIYDCSSSHIYTVFFSPKTHIGMGIMGLRTIYDCSSSHLVTMNDLFSTFLGLIFDYLTAAQTKIVCQS